MRVVFPDETKIIANEHVKGICYFANVEFFEHPANAKMKDEERHALSDAIAGIDDAFEAAMSAAEQALARYPDAKIVEADEDNYDVDPDEDFHILLVDPTGQAIAGVGVIVEDYRCETIH